MTKTVSRTAACAAAAMLFVSGCATTPPAGQAAPLDPATVKVYEAAQLAQNRYSVVKRLPVESAQAKFSLPTYLTRDDGIAALKADAARFGANALMGVACYDQGQFALFAGKKEPRLICYARAIQLH